MERFGVSHENLILQSRLKAMNSDKMLGLHHSAGNENMTVLRFRS